MKKSNLLIVTLLVVLLAATGASAATLVWSDSFEETAAGAFPKGWYVYASYDHMIDGTTGWRVVELDDAPEGEKVAKFIAGDRANNAPKPTFEIAIPEIAHGRVEFFAYTPVDEGANWGMLKPYNGDTRLVDFWLSSKGDIRIPGHSAQALGAGVWLELAYEWNASTGLFNAFQKVDGEWVEKTSEEVTISQIPNKLYSDGGTTEGRTSWGMFDNIRLYDLSK